MKKVYYINFLITIILIVSCNNPNPSESSKSNVKDKAKENIVVPDFNADSAYQFVATQVEFGPRVPNTPEHIACAKYLFNKLNEFADTVVLQNFKARAFDGTVLSGKNIIGSFHPRQNNRLLLCAHWDSRPFADYDKNPENFNTPIDGANDGASGVGVLLEIARQFSSQKPKIGVDIIFFDAEDYGPPKQNQKRNEGDYWALGSQHWARNPHVYNYYAKYGILLDMVGAEGATFYMEGYSLMYAPEVLKNVWTQGNRLGYTNYFIFKQMGYIDDDHKYVNEILQIPTIDIIHLDQESSNSSFFEHWHTVNDNMDNISRETLKAVGQTLLEVIYREK